MSGYKKILIGTNPFFEDWLEPLQNIKKENIILFDFKNINVKKILIQKNIYYILPLSDLDFNLISKVLGFNRRILYPRSNIIELLNNKVLFTIFMINHFDQYIPHVYYLNNTKMLPIVFPIISKPIYSTNGDGMEIFHNEDDFSKCTNRILVQKFIDYEYEYAAYMLCIDGIIITHKIIRHKFEKYTIKNKNFSSDYETINNFDLTIFKQIVFILNYSGGMCINFKYNKVTNELYIFEINPRFGGSAFSNNFIYELLCIP